MMPSCVRIGAGEFFTADCFDVLAKLPASSVDLILADLPYGTTRNAWDVALPLDRFWAEAWRVLKRRGAAVLTAQQPFTAQLGASCIEHLKYELIWQKKNPTGFLNARKQPLKEHENILVFYRGHPTYRPQGTQLLAKPRRRKSEIGSTNYGSGRDTGTFQEVGHFPRSIVYFPGDGGRGLHPTVKPVALFEYLICTFSDPGDVVLDVTAGSGTTAVAAERAARRWICIERDETYASIAMARIRAEVETAGERRGLLAAALAMVLP